MSKTLLLADDSVVIQKLVGLSFANEDVKLVTTDNGDDAIRKAREHRPDVILADVVMPGRSGYEVCQAIKQDPELAHVPVILLTGTFEAFDEARARAVGSNGHITKPFEAQALVERVNTLLREAAAAKQSAPTQLPELEVFAEDASTGGENSFGHDVTRAAEPHFLRPTAAPRRPAAEAASHAAAARPASAPAAPAMRAPLAAADLDFDDAPSLAPLADDDSFAAPLELPRRGANAPAAGAPSAPSRAHAAQTATPPAPLDLDVAEDDLLVPPVERARPAPTATRVPIARLDVTPAMHPSLDAPPPIPASESHARRGGLDALTDLMEPPDGSLTTIIMSEGQSSRDDLSLGEVEASVRSLDDESEAEIGGTTMLADDLFAETDRRDDSDSGFDFGSGSVPAARPATPSPAAARTAFPRPFAADLVLEEDPLAASFSSRLRRGAPDVASRYDVSTSELIDADEDQPATVTSFDAPEATSFVAPAPEPVTAVRAAPPAVRPAVPPPVPAAFSDTLREADADEIEIADGLLGEPIGSGGPSSAQRPAHTSGAGAGVDLGPVMRDRIHDTLERVAWEALADLSDSLVKQVVERVEAIAWEVIPQMAETLIREEIRRMKGDDE